MPDTTGHHGLIDTSVVIALDRIDPALLPDQISIAAITMADSPRGRTPLTISMSAPAGRTGSSRRAVDLLIAATALAHELPLYTQNPDDFAQLDGLRVVAVAVA